MDNVDELINIEIELQSLISVYKGYNEFKYWEQFAEGSTNISQMVMDRLLQRKEDLLSRREQLKDILWESGIRRSRNET